jgi:hypothetical protein
MASIFEKFKTIAVNALIPESIKEMSGELAYLREMYYSKGGNLRAGQWYRLMNEAAKCVGFSFYCKCGQEYKFLDAFEWIRDYTCQQCKTKFELLKFVGIDTHETPVTQWKSICDAKLPARPSIQGKQTQSTIDTWGDSDNSGISWCGNAPQGSDGSWV